MPIDDRYRNLPFTEASDYLRGKINLDTDKWDDILDAEHDAAFVVAGAKGSLLSDLRGAVDRAIASGQRPEEFLKDFERISEGWNHLGDKAWRANIIHMTNLTQSYAAGRATYQLDPEVMRVQPYLRWVHSNSGRPRPAHLALDGRVFRADQIPFYPPNGYGCLCRTISLTQAQVERQGLKVDSLQAGDTLPYRDERGNLREAVIAPDKGFDRIPGQGNRRALLEGMIARMPASVAAPLRAELDRIDDEFVERRRRLSAPSDVAKIPPDTRDSSVQAKWTYLDNTANFNGVNPADIGQQDQARIAYGKSQIPKRRRDQLEAAAKTLNEEISRLRQEIREMDRKLWEPPGTTSAVYKTPEGKEFKKRHAELLRLEKRASRSLNTAMGKVRADLISRVSEADAAAWANQIKILKSATKNASEEEIRAALIEFRRITGQAPLWSVRRIKQTANRAFADLDGYAINVGQNRNSKQFKATLFHELGHHLEHAAPPETGTDLATAAFLQNRKTGRARPLNEILGRNNYDANELAVPDAFIDPYVGKLYGNKTTEVISMGVEHFASVEEMTKLYQRDPDHFWFIIGTLY